MFELHGYGPSIIYGMLLTISVGLLSLVISVILGILAALAKLSIIKPLNYIATVYTTVIRGVPDLVLMLLIYFGGQILVNRISDTLGLGHIDVDPFAAGVLTIGFIFGAYMGETFRGAILAIPKGQIEAAQAFGMNPRQVFFRVTFPQMMRHALPGFGNNWLVMLKTTALVSIIGLGDMVDRATKAAGATREPFTFHILAALLYLVLTFLSSVALDFLKKRYNLGVKEVV